MIKEINEKLPDNVYVQVYSMVDFPFILSRLNELWTGVTMPSGLTGNDALPWCMAYLQYQIEDKKNYLIWFFNNGINDEQIIKEIEEFLKE